jgi:nicotinamidase-related amidase
VGLAYDFCVGETAIDGRKLGFKSFVIKDATKAIHPESESTMKEMLKIEGV